jgi:serine O-acetyltransferase
LSPEICFFPERSGHELSDVLNASRVNEVEGELLASLKLAASAQGMPNPIWQSLGNAGTIAEALVLILSGQLAGKTFTPEAAQAILAEALNNADVLEKSLIDLLAHYNNDPCIRFHWQPLVFAKGYHATVLHRVAHYYWTQEEFFISHGIQYHLSCTMGVDIHPAVRIGAGLFLDHATGLVIGETAELGKDVCLLHGVTLGSNGNAKQRGRKRHPTIEDGVLIGAGAILLGDIRIGCRAKIGAGAVVVKDVLAGSTVLGEAAKSLARREV